MLFGVISYALTGGRRDFTSTSQIVASEYDLLCMPEHSRAATELLQGLPGGTGRDVAAPSMHSMPAPSAGTYGPPPTGAPSPGPGPGQPGGPPAPVGWEPAPPDVPVTGPTYGEMIEKRRQEERERAERERTEHDA
jgi:hypothetical protein